LDVTTKKSVTDGIAALYEVLTEQRNGHRAVVRVRAADADAARAAVQADLDDGAQVLDVAVPGTGLGSSDGRAERLP
jgi:hypothetical protein